MTGKIFINYRRDDDQGVARALYERLKQEFTADGLFLDRENIEPGHDFAKTIRDELDRSDAILVLIGPRWQELLSARINAANDLVLIEIDAALRLGILVVPVFANGAVPPSPQDMPQAIQALAGRNGVSLTWDSFEADCQRLIPVLRKQLQDAAAQRSEAQAIYKQISADAQIQRAERLAIMQELQTKIFDITAAIPANRLKSANDAFKSMDEYTRNG